MIFSFVSRERMTEALALQQKTHDAQQKAHVDRVADLFSRIRALQEELAKEQERSRELMDTVLSLKVSGATSIARAVATGQLKTDPKPRSAIDQALDEHPKASNNIALRNHLSRWAAKRLKEKPDDVDENEWMEVVCDELRTWSAVSDVAEDSDE